jgi:hypothetical protein
MRYTVRPKIGSGYGQFSVMAGDAREALELAKGLLERGVESVEILGTDGALYDVADLERIVLEEEAT